MSKEIKSKKERYTGDPYTYREFIYIAHGLACTEGFPRTETVTITNV